MESAVRSGYRGCGFTVVKSFPQHELTHSASRRRVACSSHQASDGWWSGELETNVTMTAEHVLT